jgi:hypothetical protein
VCDRSPGKLFPGHKSAGKKWNTPPLAGSVRLREEFRPSRGQVRKAKREAIAATGYKKRVSRTLSTDDYVMLKKQVRNQPCYGHIRTRAKF